MVVGKGLAISTGRKKKKEEEEATAQRIETAMGGMTPQEPSTETKQFGEQLQKEIQTGKPQPNDPNYNANNREIFDKDMYVYRNEKGNLSGAEINGKTYFGLSPDEVNQMVNAEMQKRQVPTGAVDLAATQQSKQEAQNINELGGYSSFQQPEQIQQSTSKELPGGITAPKTFNAPVNRDIFSEAKDILSKNNLSYEDYSAGNYQNISEHDKTILSGLPNLTKTDYEVLVNGDAKVSLISEEIEMIPYFSKVGRRFGVEISTPGKKVEDLKKLVSETKDLANSNADSVGVSLTREQAIDRINKNYNDLLILQSKLKLISLQSPELQSNPEQINSLNNDIEIAINSLNGAKMKANGGIPLK